MQDVLLPHLYSLYNLLWPIIQCQQLSILQPFGDEWLSVSLAQSIAPLHQLRMSTWRVHLLETAKSQRSDTNTSLSISCGKTPHDHHITEVWAGLDTRDSKISDLRRVFNVYFFSGFPIALLVGTSSFRFAQPELPSSSVWWTLRVHPKASACLCSQDLSEHQNK